MIADGLGVELDEIRETHEAPARGDDFDIAAGRVEEGTTAALRFEVQGIVNGRPAIVVEHVTRLHDDLAPDWPQPRRPRRLPHHSSRGRPTLQCDLEMTDADGDHNTAGLVVTAMRLVNAIPAVCAAEPGLLSTLDLPLVTGRHVMR